MLNLNQEIIPFLVQDFDLLATENQVSEHDYIIDITLLQEKLCTKILDLLHHDFEKLLQIFYHIDVSQKKFEAAMQNDLLPEVARQLADLAIERQIEKIAWRNKYKG